VGLALRNCLILEFVLSILTFCLIVHIHSKLNNPLKPTPSYRITKIHIKYIESKTEHIVLHLKSVDFILLIFGVKK
jgi:hypothetical protein